MSKHNRERRRLRAKAKLLGRRSLSRDELTRCLKHGKRKLAGRK